MSSQSSQYGLLGSTAVEEGAKADVVKERKGHGRLAFGIWESYCLV